MNNPNCMKCKAISCKECGKMEYVRVSAGAGFWRKVPDDRCEEMRDKLWRDDVCRVLAAVRPLNG